MHIKADNFSLKTDRSRKPQTVGRRGLSGSLASLQLCNSRFIQEEIKVDGEKAELKKQTLSAKSAAPPLCSRASI